MQCTIFLIQIFFYFHYRLQSERHQGGFSDAERARYAEFFNQRQLPQSSAYQAQVYPGFQHYQWPSYQQQPSTFQTVAQVYSNSQNQSVHPASYMTVNPNYSSPFTSNLPHAYPNFAYQSGFGQLGLQNQQVSGGSLNNHPMQLSGTTSDSAQHQESTKTNQNNQQLRASSNQDTVNSRENEVKGNSVNSKFKTVQDATSFADKIANEKGLLYDENEGVYRCKYEQTENPCKVFITVSKTLKDELIVVGQFLHEYCKVPTRESSETEADHIQSETQNDNAIVITNFKVSGSKKDVITSCFNTIPKEHQDWYIFDENQMSFNCKMTKVNTKGEKAPEKCTSVLNISISGENGRLHTNRRHIHGDKPEEYEVHPDFPKDVKLKGKGKSSISAQLTSEDVGQIVDKKMDSKFDQFKHTFLNEIRKLLPKQWSSDQIHQDQSVKNVNATEAQSRHEISIKSVEPKVDQVASASNNEEDLKIQCSPSTSGVVFKKQTTTATGFQSSHENSIKNVDLAPSASNNNEIIEIPSSPDNSFLVEEPPLDIGNGDDDIVVVSEETVVLSEDEKKSSESEKVLKAQNDKVTLKMEKEKPISKTKLAKMVEEGYNELLNKVLVHDENGAREVAQKLKDTLPAVKIQDEEPDYSTLTTSKHSMRFVKKHSKHWLNQMRPVVNGSGGMCLYYSAMQYLTGTSNGSDLLRLHCAMYMILNKEELIDHCQKQRWKRYMPNDFNNSIIETLYQREYGDLLSMEVISRVLNIRIRSVMVESDRMVPTALVEYNDILGSSVQDPLKTVFILWTSTYDLDNEEFDWNHFEALVPKFSEGNVYSSVPSSESSDSSVPRDYSFQSDEEQETLSDEEQVDETVQECVVRLNELAAGDPDLQGDVLQYALEMQDKIPANIPGPEIQPDLSNVPLDKSSQQSLKKSKYYSNSYKPLKSTHPAISLYTSALINLKGSCTKNEALALKLKCILYCIIHKEELLDNAKDQKWATQLRENFSDNILRALYGQDLSSFLEIEALCHVLSVSIRTIKVADKNCTQEDAVLCNDIFGKNLPNSNIGLAKNLILMYSSTKHENDYDFAYDRFVPLIPRKQVPAAGLANRDDNTADLSDEERKMLEYQKNILAAYSKNSKKSASKSNDDSASEDEQERVPMKKYLQPTGDPDLDSLVDEFNHPFDFLSQKVAIYYVTKLKPLARVPLGRKGNSRHVVTNKLNQGIYRAKAKGEKYKFKLAQGYHNCDRGSFKKPKYYYRLFELDEDNDWIECRGMYIKDGKIMNGGANPPKLENVLFLRYGTRLHKSGKFERRITEFFHVPDSMPDLLNKRLFEYVGNDKGCSTYHGNRKYTKQTYIYRG